MGGGGDEQGVEELLGRHGLHQHVAEEGVVFFVVLGSAAGEVIGFGGGDPADQGLDVVAGVAEVGGQAVEEFRVAGRVMVAEVVDRVDEAAAQEVAPGRVDEGAGELEVFAVR